MNHRTIKVTHDDIEKIRLSLLKTYSDLTIVIEKSKNENVMSFTTIESMKHDANSFLQLSEKIRMGNLDV